MKRTTWWILSIFILLLFGCAKARFANDGYFDNYDDFQKGGVTGSGTLPDHYYIEPGIDLDQYKKIIVADFTSKTPNIGLISGFSITEYKDIRKDLPDTIATAIDGQVFDHVERVNVKVKSKNPSSLQAFKADALLIGNISELRQAAILLTGDVKVMAMQVEMKLIDLKTKKTIVKFIDRNKTDEDKYAMPVVRNLMYLLADAGNNNTAQKTTSSQAIKEYPLTVRSNVMNDTVYIDGVNYGSTRLDTTIPAGQHTIRVEKPGYSTFEQKINVRKEMTIWAKLKKDS